MTANDHKHRAKVGMVAPFRGQIATAKENRAAHGNICEIAVCLCGATRFTNINQQHRERGRWTPPDKAQ